MSEADFAEGFSGMPPLVKGERVIDLISRGKVGRRGTVTGFYYGKAKRPWGVNVRWDGRKSVRVHSLQQLGRIFRVSAWRAPDEDGFRRRPWYYGKVFKAVLPREMFQ